MRVQLELDGQLIPFSCDPSPSIAVEDCTNLAQVKRGGKGRGLFAVLSPLGEEKWGYTPTHEFFSSFFFAAAQGYPTICAIFYRIFLAICDRLWR